MWTFYGFYARYLCVFYSFEKTNLSISVCQVTLQGCRPWGCRGCVPWHPQILADHLTLFQSRGKIMPTILLLAPSDFQTSLRPCARLSRAYRHSHCYPLYSVPQKFWPIRILKNHEEFWRIPKNPEEFIWIQKSILTQSLLFIIQCATEILIFLILNTGRNPNGIDF